MALSIKDIPANIQQQIRTLAKRGEAIRALINHLGESAKTVGVEQISALVATIREVDYEATVRRTREIFREEYHWDVPASAVPFKPSVGPVGAQNYSGELLIVDQTQGGSMPAPLPEQRTIEQVGSVIQGVAVNGGELKQVDFSDLIPKNPKPYYPVRVAGKVKDYEVMVKTYEVCRCVEPKWYNPKVADRKAKGVTFCKACGRPSWRRPVLLQGEQSTGKNTMLDNLAKRFNLPQFRIEFDDTTDESLLVGDVLPSNDGTFKFVYGPLSLAVKYGGMFIGDEIFMIRAECSSILNCLLEPGGYIYIKRTNEVIRPHPNFWFVATGNEGYEGTKELNKALKSRFKILNIDYSRKVDSKLTGDKRLTECTKKLRELYVDGRLDQPVGPRDLIQFEENVVMFGVKVAIRLFVNKFGKDYRTIVIDQLATIVPASEIGVVEEEEEEDDEDDEEDEK